MPTSKLSWFVMWAQRRSSTTATATPAANLVVSAKSCCIAIAGRPGHLQVVAARDVGAAPQQQHRHKHADSQQRDANADEDASPDGEARPPRRAAE